MLSACFAAFATLAILAGLVDGTDGLLQNPNTPVPDGDNLQPKLEWYVDSDGPSMQQRCNDKPLNGLLPMRLQPFKSASLLAIGFAQPCRGASDGLAFQDRSCLSDGDEIDGSTLISDDGGVTWYCGGQPAGLARYHAAYVQTRGTDCSGLCVIGGQLPVRTLLSAENFTGVPTIATPSVTCTRDGFFWTEVVPLPIPIVGATAIQHDDAIVVIGGLQQQPSSNLWSIKVDDSTCFPTGGWAPLEIKPENVSMIKFNGSGYHFDFDGPTMPKPMDPGFTKDLSSFLSNRLQAWAMTAPLSLFNPTADPNKFALVFGGGIKVKDLDPDIDLFSIAPYLTSVPNGLVQIFAAQGSAAPVNGPMEGELVSPFLKWLTGFLPLPPAEYGAVTSLQLVAGSRIGSRPENLLLGYNSSDAVLVQAGMAMYIAFGIGGPWMRINNRILSLSQTSTDNSDGLSPFLPAGYGFGLNLLIVNRDGYFGHFSAVDTFFTAMDPFTGQVWRGYPHQCTAQCDPGMTFLFTPCAQNPYEGYCAPCSKCRVPGSNLSDFEVITDGFQYVARPCRPTADTVCRSCSRCRPQQDLIANCTATEDTECTLGPPDTIHPPTPSQTVVIAVGSNSDLAVLAAASTAVFALAVGMGACLQHIATEAGQHASCHSWGAFKSQWRKAVARAFALCWPLVTIATYVYFTVSVLLPTRGANGDAYSFLAAVGWSCHSAFVVGTILNVIGVVARAHSLEDANARKSADASTTTNSMLWNALRCCFASMVLLLSSMNPVSMQRVHRYLATPCAGQRARMMRRVMASCCRSGQTFASSGVSSFLSVILPIIACAAIDAGHLIAVSRLILNAGRTPELQVSEGMVAGVMLCAVLNVIIFSATLLAQRKKLAFTLLDGKALKAASGTTSGASLAASGAIISPNPLQLSSKPAGLQPATQPVPSTRAVAVATALGRLSSLSPYQDLHAAVADQPVLSPAHLLARSARPIPSIDPTLILHHPSRPAPQQQRGVAYVTALTDTDDASCTNSNSSHSASPVSPNVGSNDEQSATDSGRSDAETEHAHVAGAAVNASTSAAAVNNHREVLSGVAAVQLQVGSSILPHAPRLVVAAPPPSHLDVTVTDNRGAASYTSVSTRDGANAGVTSVHAAVYVSQQGQEEHALVRFRRMQLEAAARLPPNDPYRQAVQGYSPGAHHNLRPIPSSNGDPAVHANVARSGSSAVSDDI